MRKNVFSTRIYELKEFSSREEMLKHLEYKIKAVIDEHTPFWDVIKTERNITDISASAKIHMVKG